MHPARIKWRHRTKAVRWSRMDRVWTVENTETLLGISLFIWKRVGVSGENPVIRVSPFRVVRTCVGVWIPAKCKKLNLDQVINIVLRRVLTCIFRSKSIEPQGCQQIGTLHSMSFAVNHLPNSSFSLRYYKSQQLRLYCLLYLHIMSASRCHYGSEHKALIY